MSPPLYNFYPEESNKKQAVKNLVQDLVCDIENLELNQMKISGEEKNRNENEIKNNNHEDLNPEQKNSHAITVKDNAAIKKNMEQSKNNIIVEEKKEDEDNMTIVTIMMQMKA